MMGRASRSDLGPVSAIPVMGRPCGLAPDGYRCAQPILHYCSDGYAAWQPPSCPNYRPISSAYLGNAAMTTHEAAPGSVSTSRSLERKVAQWSGLRGLSIKLT